MYIFVIGGVISSMRVISSSIRALLKWGSYFPLTFNELTHIVCTNLCRLSFLHLGFRVRSSELFGSFYLKKFNTCDWRLQWKTDHTKTIQKKVDPLVHFCYAMSLFKLILWICTFYLFFKCLLLFCTTKLYVNCWITLLTIFAGISWGCGCCWYVFNDLFSLQLPAQEKDVVPVLSAKTLLATIAHLFSHIWRNLRLFPIFSLPWLLLVCRKLLKIT